MKTDTIKLLYECFVFVHEENTVSGFILASLHHKINLQRLVFRHSYAISLWWEVLI